jgi:CheY-like chemotaxis protein
MKKPRVLMIEDDLDDRYITETYFAQNGYTISLDFFDGHKDIVQYLSDLPYGTLPDLIVLDPGKRGNDTLKQLKTHHVFREIPVIVLSEVTQRSVVKEAYRLGANSFIQKPATHDLTKEKIGTFAKYWFDVVEL